MSRIGQKPIPVPEKVKVAIQGRAVTVEGPKGSLSWTPRPEVSVAYDPAAHVITVSRKNDERLPRQLHGTTRTLIANMIEGCLNGYRRELEVHGVGYGVQVRGSQLLLNVGFANPRTFEIPAGVQVEVQAAQARGGGEPARFSVAGPDKHAVGEFAARVRKARPPEPYKGKGVRYAGEYVRRKVGKAFAGTGTV
ncbi:MAG: 50S ribosomal protein L6 [Phycisphaerae bacterium SM23_33]|nr:MAG: 50S ribosomal protein L6 [Phycisphaerae bacterium SM23_33]